MVNKAMDDTEKNTVNFNGNSLNATALKQEVRNARKKPLDGMKDRWVTPVQAEKRREYNVCTMLEIRFRDGAEKFGGPN